MLPPHEKGHGPLFKQTWIPFTQGFFVPSLVEIGPVVKISKFRRCYHSLEKERLFKIEFPSPKDTLHN